MSCDPGIVDLFGSAGTPGQCAFDTCLLIFVLQSGDILKFADQASARKNAASARKGTPPDELIKWCGISRAAAKQHWSISRSRQFDSKKRAKKRAKVQAIVNGADHGFLLNPVRLRGEKRKGWKWEINEYVSVHINRQKVSEFVLEPHSRARSRRWGNGARDCTINFRHSAEFTAR